MNGAKLIGVLGVCLTAAWVSTCAAAQPAMPYGGGFGGGGPGYWYVFPYTYNYQQETIPYYALHPPVYYSLPVPRTYGYSPFAYPPGVMTPDIEAGGPIEITNPYVPQHPAPKKPAPEGVQFRSARLEIIENPYVVPKSIAAN